MVWNIYDFKQHERYLFAWYMELVKSGEIEKVFNQEFWYLTGFLGYFAKDGVRKPGMIFALDEETDAISVAMWFEPFMSGAFVGIWVDPAKRHAKEMLEEVAKRYDAALKFFPVLIGLCKQPELRKIQKQIGYVKLEPTIPKLWDGEDVDAYYLTAETFKNPFKE